MIRAAGVVFFAYIGFDAVSTAAQEAKNPQRDMPIGILGSLVICTILYILVSFLLTGTVHYTRLNVGAPVSLAIRETGVRWGSYVVNAGALAGLSTVMLVMLLGQSRVFYSMSRDGLLWKWAGEIHPKFRTPWKSSIVVGIFVACFAAVVPIGVLGELVSIGTLLAFVIVCAGIWILRIRKPELHRPFKTPLVPFVPIMGMLVSLLMMVFLPWQTWLRMIVWLVIGMVIYFTYGRHHSKVQAASGQVQHAGATEHNGWTGDALLRESVFFGLRRFLLGIQYRSCVFPPHPCPSTIAARAPMRALRNVGFLSAALLCVVIIGTAGFHFIEHWSWFDGFYMVLTTLTTIGYGEVHPLSQVGRYFNVSIILAGVGLVFLILGALGQALLEFEFNNLFGRRKMEREIGRLQGHYIICGAGRVGRAVARQLESNPAPFIILDNNEAKGRARIREETNWLVVHADATLEAQLLAARIDQAAGLVAATTTDATNTYVVLTARRLNPSLKIIARASEEGAEKHMRTAGADQVISPYGFAGFRIAQAFLRPHVMNFLEVALLRSSELGLELEELTIDAVLDLRRPGFAFLRNSS